MNWRWWRKAEDEDDARWPGWYVRGEPGTREQWRELAIRGWGQGDGANPLSPSVQEVVDRLVAIKDDRSRTIGDVLEEVHGAQVGYLVRELRRYEPAFGNSTPGNESGSAASGVQDA